MIHGKHKVIFYLIFFLFLNPSYLFADSKKIEIAPIIKLEEISPTFEEEKDELDKLDEDSQIFDSKEKEYDISSDKKDKKVFVNLKALDKITAKTSSISIELGKTEFFGKLEIKPLKCTLSDSKDAPDTIAYIQVRDLSIKDNNQVFIFNGWTFASSPTLKSIDHPVYDLWLINCENV
tara:strand:+ start:952 stop:1485 length:534 start_codon:yes stop_codon:yes gene_type:complete